MREGFTTGNQPTAKPWLLTCASWQTGFYIQETVQHGFPGALQSLGTTYTNTFGTCQIYPPILQISQKVPLLPTFHLWWAFLFCKTILLMLDLLLLCLVHPSLPLPPPWFGQFFLQTSPQRCFPWASLPQLWESSPSSSSVYSCGSPHPLFTLILATNCCYGLLSVPLMDSTIPGTKNCFFFVEAFIFIVVQCLD